MRKENFSHLECSLARALDVVGEWWTILVVRDLFYGLSTFEQLREDLGIARNMLSARLNKLVEKGVVEKRPAREGARRQEYRLTQKGLDLFPVIMALAGWGDRWEAPKGPPILFRHGSDGHPAEPALMCRCCGEALTPGNIRPQRGPGAKRPKALPLPLRPAGK